MIANATSAMALTTRIDTARESSRLVRRWHFDHRSVGCWVFLT